MPERDQIDLYVGSVVIDVNDLDLMTNFWKEVLVYDVDLKREHWAKLVDPNERRATVALQKVPEKRTEKNRLHIDLYSKHPTVEIERVLGLGASHVHGPREDEDFVVLADPEGNLFCVIDKTST